MPKSIPLTLQVSHGFLILFISLTWDPDWVLIWIKSSKATNPRGLRSLISCLGFSRKNPGSCTHSRSQLWLNISHLFLGTLRRSSSLQRHASSRFDFFLRCNGILRREKVQGSTAIPFTVFVPKSPGRAMRHAFYSGHIAEFWKILRTHVVGWWYWLEMGLLTRKIGRMDKM